MSGAARQRAYRERQKAAGRDSIQIWLDPTGYEQLARLCDEMEIDRSAVVAKALAQLSTRKSERDPTPTMIRPAHRRRRQAYAPHSPPPAR